MKRNSQEMTALQPGVHFATEPIKLLPGWLVTIHYDRSMKPMCCVMIAPEHAGPAFYQDSWAWWEAHVDNPSAPHSPSFGRPLRLVRGSGAASDETLP